MKATKSRGAFPLGMAGGIYKCDDPFYPFLPGVDGVPEWTENLQTFRPVAEIPAAFKKSIEVNGIEETLKCYKRTDGRPEIADGRERIEAARQLVLEGKPVNFRIELVKPDATAYARRCRVVRPNYQRVPLSFAQRAEDAANLLRDLGEDPTAPSHQAVLAVAEELAVSDQTIRNWLTLGRLDPEVSALADNEDAGVPMAALVQLHTLPPEEQRVQAAALKAHAAKDGPKGNMVELARQLRDASGAGAEAKAAEPSAEQPWRAAGIRGIYRLARADRLNKSGAGCSMPEEAFSMLRLMASGGDLNDIEGLTELWNRYISGEKPQT